MTKLNEETYSKEVKSAEKTLSFVKMLGNMMGENSTTSQKTEYKKTLSNATTFLEDRKRELSLVIQHNKLVA